MKRKIFAIIIILSIIGAVVLAQQDHDIPFDPDVRVGQLDNGLTYYIRHNELPEHRAEFYIAQRVGSILEEEEQRGLAHFLEHMCFNGTKNFPGNSMIQELESKGIKFGVNVNAYTAVDQTIYNLSYIPVKREGLIDTALLILHDWSGFVLLEDKEIDSERGVIHEEWRTRNTGDYRVAETTIRNIFPHSRYGERMPIGLIDVIDNFPYQAIRDYYKKWYRPDLQAIIVVGDVDVDLIEKKIKKLFADIPAPIDPALRKEFEVPDNTEPIVSVASDPEVQSTAIQIFYKKDAIPRSLKNKTTYYHQMILEGMISSMFNQRLYELSQEPDPPFNKAQGGIGNFSMSKTKRAWTVSVSPRNNNDGENALRSILMENERMQRYGFTEPELERVKTNILRGFESAYNERENQKNGAYVNEYVRHFTNSEPSPGIEWEFNYMKDMLSDLTLDQVNELARTFVTDTNVVFAVTGPEKADVVLPTRTDILVIWDEVKKMDLEPYSDKELNTSLIEKEPVAGKIIKTEQQAFGYTCWTLSNGAKVFFKKTDYKKDQVKFSAYSPGGMSLIEDNDLPSALAINDLSTLGGVGHLSRVDLGKALTGKMVKVTPIVSNLNEGISGAASPKDFETLMQLTYLFFTQPRMDQDAYNTWNSKVKLQLENASLNPMNSLKDTLNKIMTDNRPRGKQFDFDMLEEVDYSKVISLYKERFSDAGDFTFFITGNVEADSIKGYVETYLGGLPSTGHKEKFIDRKMYPPKGIIKNHFNRQLETPKSTVVAIYTGEVPYTLQNIILMNYLESILNIVYNENIREKEGGTYGVSVRGSIRKYPRERFSLQISFDTDPAMRDELLGIVYDEINRLVKHEPDDANVQKVKEYMLKSYQEGIIQNLYWEGMISTWVINGVDLYSDYEKVVRSITPPMIRNFARQLFSQENLVEVSMNPLQ